MDSLVSSILSTMIKDITIDSGEVKAQLEKAIMAYLKSPSFKEDLAESLADSGIGWELGGSLAPLLKKEITANIKVSISKGE